MTIIKTSELTGAALDWAVAKCEGLTVEDCGKYAITAWEKDALTGEDEVVRRFNPSSDWAQGGPIIDRERIGFEIIGTHDEPMIRAQQWVRSTAHPLPCWLFGAVAIGPTPLVAAMRCYVASTYGDSVEVPDELIGG